MDMNKLSAEKQLKELDKIEQHWNKKIDNEIKSEEELESMIDSISASLYLNQRTKTMVNEREYIIACSIKEVPQKIPTKDGFEVKKLKQVILVITDRLKYEMLPNQYSPAIVRADYDYNYDVKANIRAAVEGWIRHITGTIKPEMLE